MQLPLTFGWDTILILLTSGFSVLSFAAAANVAIHKNFLKSAKYLVVLCLLWAVAEFVQLFVEGFSMSGGISNFRSSYLLLAAVVSTINFYFPISLMLDSKVRSRTFLIYLAPLFVLCLAYTYVWYFDVAQERRCYAFPDVWHNEFTLDLLFCIVCFLYIIVSSIYVLTMSMTFAKYFDRYIMDVYGGMNSAKKWLHDCAYMIYALMAFFILYLSQGTVEFAVTYKIALLVIVPTVFLNYVYFAEKHSSVLRFHDIYDVKWLAMNMEWDIRKRSDACSLAELAMCDARAEQEKLDEMDDAQVEEYRQRLDEWMEKEKPYLNPSFKVADIHSYLDIDRFSCNELFAKAYKCYFRTWVLHYRIDYAVDLMKKSPDKQIKMVAYESGFSSQTVFARSFFNIMGMSCSQYKKQYLS